LYFNGSSSTVTIPWLAQSYTESANGSTFNFTLRSGITFADGEPLNSTAVYFSFNRLLITDGGVPTGHNTGAWVLQQLVNPALSWVLSGPHNYSQSWGQQVLAQNFVQITGPMTFTLHVQHPNAAINQLLSDNPLASIIAPDYVMSHDMALFKAAGYTLPYGSPSGNSTTLINQYLLDEVATCYAGATPTGCARTYLDDSFGGSLGGTGPYAVSSVNQQSNEIILSARSGYWGGADPQKLIPQIKTIDLKYVPDTKTAEIDLQNAAHSGQAMAIDLPSDHLYDIANRTTWLGNNVLESTIPGVSMYGPEPGLINNFAIFDLNVTNPLTGAPYAFQPFADVRFRLAFADAVNVSQINQDVNNKLGQVSTQVAAPGLAPTGVFNSSITPAYSFNPDESARLLLSAMQSPLTKFTFYNGTAAPLGYFNNSFGCNPLPTSGVCAKPLSVPAINLYVASAGDAFGIGAFTQIAETINNISSTYNLGLQVSVVPVPSGTLLTTALGGSNPYYMYSLGWLPDYNWIVDYSGAMYAPNQAYPGPDKWNLSAMADLYLQQVTDTADNNVTGLIQTTQTMNEIANNGVMYLWWDYPSGIAVITSNVRGFEYNPAVSPDVGGQALEYFVYLT